MFCGMSALCISMLAVAAGQHPTHRKPFPSATRASQPGRSPQLTYESAGECAHNAYELVTTTNGLHPWGGGGHPGILINMSYFNPTTAS